MPTKKKRVGFIPRDDVMKIIDKLSIENNLSNSKIISILVEEALSVRGIFDKKIDKKTYSFLKNIDNNQVLSEDYAEFNDKEKLALNNKLRHIRNSSNTNILNQINQETYDLQTYKKFLSFLKFQEMLNEYNSL